MKLAHWTAALTLATLAITPAANAASLSECISMGKRVAAALESAQPGETTDQARNQQAAGREYCLTSMYKEGVEHYSKALQLLGKS